MPFVDRDGFKTYYQVEGKGPTIVMLYGLMGAIEGWYRHSHVDSLKNDYQLVLVDLRGHGKSDKPHDEKFYSMVEFDADIITIMDELGIKKAHFWGYSFGGHIGLRLTKYHPERFLSFILGGISPQEVPKEAWDRVWGIHDSLEDGNEAYISRLEKGGQEITPEIRASIMKFDCKALAALIRGKDIFLPMDRHLPDLDIPILFYAGENDEWGHHPRQIEIGKKLKKGKVVSIPNYGHEIRKQKELVLPHVKAFLKEGNFD
ncbi:MAG: alpha/beta fold hydrolase [Asgard group archaeon]|nr:alpha/beta fold hydrolase [Asgard group archaeon]